MEKTSRAMMQFLGEKCGFFAPVHATAKRFEAVINGEIVSFFLTISKSQPSTLQGDFYCAVLGDEFFLSSFIFDGNALYIENRGELIQNIQDWFFEVSGENLLETLRNIRKAEEKERLKEDMEKYGKALTAEERLLNSILEV